jgi:excinuclease ABC subunit C
MSKLFGRGGFSGFGPDPMRGLFESPPIDHVTGSSRAELRKGLREKAPRLPGVYGMLDRHQRLIYVGKAKVLRGRLLSYFLKATRREKAGRIIDETRTIVWEPCESEFGALIRELELIQRWKPRFNVQGLPSRDRQVWVCLGRRPAPYLYISRQPTGQELTCYGPVRGMRVAQWAVRRLNDLFQLRDCPQTQTMRFADQRELFPLAHTAGCLRYELGTCLGPCAGLATRSTYGRHVRALRAFLEGRDSAPLQRLESAMRDAAQKLEFEKAAAIRNKILPIRWLRDRLGWVDQARDRHSFVYSPRCAGQPIWYLIRRGRVVGTTVAPTEATTARKAHEAIERVFCKEFTWPNLVARHAVDHVLLVSAWFRRHPEERQFTFSAEQALAHCVRAGQSSSVSSA